MLVSISNLGLNGYRGDTMIKILNSELQRQAILTQVIEPNRFEEINGQNTLTFTTILDEKASAYIHENAVVELGNDYFDIAYYAKNQNEDGTLTIDVETEHISYRLNDPEYDMEYFAITGTPSEVLTVLLSGTSFTVGTVDFLDSVTYSAQEKKTRRMMLMEFAALLGGELLFNKFSISILTHRGEAEPRILTTGKNIRVVSKIYNKREKDINGNPLVAYTCEPVQLKDSPLALGDEVLLIQKDLGIQEPMRVVRHGYNPFNLIETELELANFVSGVEDQMYRIATTSVAKEKIYNGCKIGPAHGFVATRSDNKVRTLMNATEGISIERGDGSGESWSKVFFVDENGNQTMDGRFLMTQSGKKLLEAFRDSYGGVLKIYDADGNLNARMGVESGITDSVGGTLILYWDSPSDTGDLLQYQRVEMGIVSPLYGVVTVRDAAGRPRAGISAKTDAPIVGVADEDGNYVSYLTPTAGYINSETIATTTEIANLYTFAANLIQNHIENYHSGVAGAPEGTSAMRKSSVGVKNATEKIKIDTITFTSKKEDGHGE